MNQETLEKHRRGLIFSLIEFKFSRAKNAPFLHLQMTQTQKPKNVESQRRVV